MKIELIHYYQAIDPWKQKDVSYINTLIGSTRLISDMNFAGYGEIKFNEEDTKHAYAIIEMLEDPYTFNKKKTTCLVYDLKETKNNPKKYDKLFLYQTLGSSGNGLWYSWIAYNTKTKKSTQKTFVSYDSQDLMQALNKFFIHIGFVDRIKKNEFK